MVYKGFKPFFPLLVLFCAICLIECVDANSKCPTGFQGCGGNVDLCCSANGTVVNVAVLNQPKGCPPLKLYESNVGSIVCQTDCTEEGSCEPRNEKYAIKVENGLGTVVPPFDSGYSGKRRCWVSVPTDCTMSDEFDPHSTSTCGTEYSYEIKKLGDSGISNPVVDLLNQAVSSLVTVKLQKYCLPNANKICFLYWVIKIDVVAAFKIVKDNKDKLSTDNLRKIMKGEGLDIVWGWKMTSWTGVNVAASNMCTPSAPCAVTTSNGAKCFDITVIPKIEKYQYVDKSIVFRDVVIGADHRMATPSRFLCLFATLVSTFSFFMF